MNLTSIYRKSAYTLKSLPLAKYFFDKNLLISLLFSLLFLVAKAQPGPGGVTTNLQLWYKANTGVTASPNVSQWLDQSGNNYHLNQGTAVSQPGLITDDINFNPSISFDGGSDYLPIATLNYNSVGAIDKIYIFTVFKTGYSGPTYNNNWAFIDFDRSDYFDYYIQGGGNLGFSYSTSTVRDISGSNTSLNDDSPYLTMAQYDNSLVNDTRLRVNGLDDFSGDIEPTSTTIGVGTTRYGFLGDGSEATTQDGSRNGINYDGEIAEIFYYQGATLSSTQIQQIESYLAIKYGLTLDQSTPQNYIASDGTTVLFDATANSGYLNDIAGIGRDDNSGLDQPKSKSENSDALLTLDKGGAFSTDLDFLLWGNDDGSAVFSDFGTHPSYSTILGRTWRVDVNGAIGTVSLDFDLSGLKNTGNGSDYAILIDGTDADFTSGATAHTTGASITGNTLSFTGINFSDGDYFTIAYNSPAPGGAITNLQLWLRSDRGVFEDVAAIDPAETGDNIEVWQDQSANGHMLIQDVGGNPTLELKSNKNTIDFSAGSNYLRGSSVITGTSARSMFVVLRPNSLTPGTSSNAAFSLAPNASAGAGYGLFIEEPDGASSGMGLRVSGNKLMDYTTSLTTPTIIQSQSAANEDVTDTEFYANGMALTDVSTESANLLNTSGLGIIAGGFSSNADNTPEAAFDFDGDVYEIIVYNTDISDLIREQLNTYLSIKYGLTKQSEDIVGTPTIDERDYIASDGSTILWDWSLNSVYSNDIAGIIRDDFSDFELTLSKSINNEAIVSLDKSGSFSNDQDYFLWGNDDNPLTTTSVGAHPSYTERVERIWKISTTGTAGTVTVSFELGDGIRNSGVATDYALLIDTDTDFSSGATAHITGATIVGNTLTFTNVSFSNNNFFTLAAPAAKAPGGIYNNLRLWLRADLGVTGIGNASDWADQSNSGFSAIQATTADQPGILSQQINFNNALDFDGSSDHLTITGGIFGNDNYDDLNIYVVSTTNSVQNSSVLFETTAGTNGRVNAQIPWGDNLVYFDGGGACCVTNQISTNWGGSIGTPYLWSFYGSTTSTPGGVNMEILRNGNQLTTTSSYSSWTGNSSDMLIGQGGGLFFDGEIGEVIVYTGSMTASQEQKIHSYIAIKYGIPLDQTTPINLVSSNGAIIYGATSTHAGYLNDIAGIGKDEASALDQRKTKSLSDDAIITMNKAGGFIGDREYIVWGNDDGAFAATDVGVHPSYATRIERLWKVDISGTPGTVDIDIELVSGIYNSGNAADYALLIDSDTDFSSGATAHTTGASLIGNVLSFTGVSFTDGDFFTLALPESAGPGGKSLGLKVWLKANSGLTGTTNASAWEDQSPFDHNLTQGTPAAQPTIVSEAINFNPALSFDNSSDYMPMETLNYSGAGSISDVAVFAVFNTGSNSAGQGDNWSFLDFDRSDFFNAYVWGTGEMSMSFTTPAGTQDVQGITPLNDNVTHIGGVIYESGTVVDSKIRVDGTEDRAVDQVTTGNLIGSANTRYAFVGDGSEADAFDGARNNSYYSGQIAEVIYYQDEVLSSTEIQQIESYLAVKYGITLTQTPGQNYLASDGAAIYNATTTHSGYVNDIAGIGRDDDSQLDQQKSKSINPDAVITIDKGGAFPSDRDFLIWGNNDGALSPITASVPAGYDERLERIWRVDVSGSPGSVAFEIELPAAVYNSGNASNYALLIDTDTDFSDATAHVTGASLTGNTLSFTNVSFGDNNYFTIAIPTQPFPGGVTGLALWFKGDRGVTGTTNASNWEDQSTNQYDATQSLALSQPAIANDAINYNTVLRYDGTDDYMPVSGLFYNTANSIDQIYTFVVFQSSFVGTLFDENWAFIDYDRSEYFDFYLQGTGELGFSYNGSAVQDISGTSTTLNDGQPHLGFGQYDNSIINDTRLRVDGADEFNADVEANLEALGSGTATRYGIIGDGSESSSFNDGNINGYYYEGDIAEIIYYQDQVLSASEINQIESYLAIKYGITLDQTSPQNYVATDATVVFDATANAGYTFDIAGIGRDDQSGLMQVKSGSINSDAIVTFALTDQGGDFANPDNFDSDLEFITWANNDLALNSDGVTDTDGTIIQTRLARVWKTQETGTIGSVTIQFDASTIDGPGGPGNNDLTNVRLLVDADGVFATGATVVSPTTIDVGNNLVEFEHDFIVGSGYFFSLGTTNIVDTPLPVTLIEFKAQALENTVVLSWKTASELNNDYFTVERSQDALDWKPVVQLEGAGTTSEINAYAFVDDGPAMGLSYYRLKQTDFDGTIDYSKTVSVRMEPKGATEVYPNPSDGIFTVRSTSELSDIQLINQLGYSMPIKMSRTNEYEVTIDASQNQRGIYTLRVFDDFVVRTIKVLIQ